MRWAFALLLLSCGEAADPSAPGPHPVGIRTIEITDASRSRTLLVDVWYPAKSEVGRKKTYALDPGIGVTLAELEGSAIEDAPIAKGRFPLVLFSHGFGGIRFQSFFLTEHLASHGYVVAAPDHPGNRIFDFGDLGNDDAVAQSVIDRPLDVLFARDALLSDPSFSIDPERVAVSGHSFGGWTTFEVGRRDPSIAAFVPLAPGFRNGATPEMAKELGRPLLVVGGSADVTCPFEEDQRPAYRAALPPKGLLRIEGAGHLDFSNLCDVELARAFVDDGCDPNAIEPSTVQAITKTITTAFLGIHLLDEDHRIEDYAGGPAEYAHAD